MLKQKSEPIRVVVVDDSPSARELLVNLLHESPGMQVVGTGTDGAHAVRLIERMRPDVVTMDIRMPQMDGLQATRRIMFDWPTPIVIVTESVMRGGVDLQTEAVRAGALAVVRKPMLDDRVGCEQMIETVRLMSDVPVVRWYPAPRIDAPSLMSVLVDRTFEVVGIAASTGGPTALARILCSLPKDFALPILIVQHMTEQFTAEFATWLDGQTRLHVSIAADGDVLKPGCVLLAPNNFHLMVEHQDIAMLSREPAYKGLRPAANYLFDSLARVYGAQTIGIVLSGMGDDGADGAASLHRAGGLLLAQDRASCVVNGMPSAAYALRAIDYVLSPADIAEVLLHVSAQKDFTGEKNYG